MASSSTAKKLIADRIIMLGDLEDEMATNLYYALRSFKQQEVDVVICESLPTEGVGKAVMDRIERAANKIIQ